MLNDPLRGPYGVRFVPAQCEGCGVNFVGDEEHAPDCPIEHPSPRPATDLGPDSRRSTFLPASPGTAATP
jgi:hypothetical protein